MCKRVVLTLVLVVMSAVPSAGRAAETSLTFQPYASAQGGPVTRVGDVLLPGPTLGGISVGPVHEVTACLNLLVIFCQRTPYIPRIAYVPVIATIPDIYVPELARVDGSGKAEASAMPDGRFSVAVGVGPTYGSARAWAGEEASFIPLLGRTSATITFTYRMDAVTISGEPSVCADVCDEYGPSYFMNMSALPTCSDGNWGELVQATPPPALGSHVVSITASCASGLTLSSILIDFEADATVSREFGTAEASMAGQLNSISVAY